jgi:hypothetical protein
MAFGSLVWRNHRPGASTTHTSKISINCGREDPWHVWGAPFEPTCCPLEDCALPERVAYSDTSGEWWRLLGKSQKASVFVGLLPSACMECLEF